MANNKRLTALTVRHLNVTDNIRIRGTLFANSSLTDIYKLVYPTTSDPGISMEGSSIIKIKDPRTMMNNKDKNTIKVGTAIFKRECGELSREGYK